MNPFTQWAKKIPAGQQDQGHEGVQHDYVEGYQPPYPFILIQHIIFWIKSNQKQNTSPWAWHCCMPIFTSSHFTLKDKATV